MPPSAMLGGLPSERSGFPFIAGMATLLGLRFLLVS